MVSVPPMWAYRLVVRQTDFNRVITGSIPVMPIQYQTFTILVLLSPHSRMLIKGRSNAREVLSVKTYKILCSLHRHKLDGAAQVSTEETLNFRHGEVEMRGSIPRRRINIGMSA